MLLQSVCHFSSFTCQSLQHSFTCPSQMSVIATVSHALPMSVTAAQFCQSLWRSFICSSYMPVIAAQFHMSVSVAQFHMLFPYVCRCGAVPYASQRGTVSHAVTICLSQWQFHMPVSVAQFHMLFPYVCHCSTVLHVSHCSAAQFHVLHPHDTIDSFCSSFIVMYISTGFIQSLKIWKVWKAGPFFHARESGIFIITVHR